MSDRAEPGVVPELLVRDVRASMEFWCDVCGFSVRYERLEEGFVYLVRDGAHLMLEQLGAGRNWITGELSPPFGRGMNLQIAVDDVDSLVASLERTDHALFMQPEVTWYRTGDREVGVKQFLVTDPDGYLVRFQSRLPSE